MARLKCFSLILGARNTPSGGKHFSRHDEKRIRSITFRHFPDGFTILDASGGWFDPQQKRFIGEDSRQILVCARNLRSLRAWSTELARALKQQELLVVELGPASTLKAVGNSRVVKRPVHSTRQ